MSKLKTYSVISLAPFSHYFSPYSLPQKNLTKLNANEQKLLTGIQQRSNVIPKDISLAANTKKIGFLQPHSENIQTTAMESNNTIQNTNSLVGRNAKIFFQDISHMHNVPVQPKGYRWVVQLERKAAFKNPCSGWTYVSDSFSKRVVKFVELDQAISYCSKMGFGFEVQYPHFRYHQKKSYADNFKWKGPPKNEDDF